MLRSAWRIPCPSSTPLPCRFAGRHDGAGGANSRVQRPRGVPGTPHRKRLRSTRLNQFPNSNFLSRLSSVAFAQPVRAAPPLHATMDGGACFSLPAGRKACQPPPLGAKPTHTKRTHFCPQPEQRKTLVPTPHEAAFARPGRARATPPLPCPPPDSTGRQPSYTPPPD
jgi:hypothetical protein